MSTGVGMSSCCLSGKLNDSAQPVGREETIGGLPTYVSEPEGNELHSKAKSIIFLVDIFGWKLPNIRLLADEYARAGFYCYVPDVHEGDSLPVTFLQNVEPPLAEQAKLTVADKAKNAAVVPATLGPWLIKHREAVARPLIDGFVNTVRMVPGTDKIGVVGFCWGGRYAILQAHGNAAKKDSGAAPVVGGADAAYACHPSLVAVPADFDDVTKPLSLALGEKDSLLDETARGGIMDCLAKKTDVVHEIRVYEDQVHGFALRGDWSSEKDKQAMDDAQKQGIEWFKKYLS